MGYQKSIKYLVAIAISLATLVSHAEGEREVTITKPPASIAQWYKPENKRQVWLHTMFSLRREMQAMSEYAAYEDKERLVRWVEKFADDYKRIGKMVPEWDDELEYELLERLQRAAKAGDYPLVGSTQQKIAQSCNGCHKEFRAVTASLYRGSNFDAAVVEDSETMEELEYREAMVGLGTAMNRIIIAMEDERLEAAEQAYDLMAHRINDLAQSCSACHNTDRQRDYLLGEESLNRVETLGELIRSRDIQQSQRTLGGIAVEVCATCHSIHRNLSDLRRFID